MESQNQGRFKVQRLETTPGCLANPSLNSPRPSSMNFHLPCFIALFSHPSIRHLLSFRLPLRSPPPIQLLLTTLVIIHFRSLDTPYTGIAASTSLIQFFVLPL